MRNVRYDPKRAREILPLLEAIGRELTERSEALATLEEEIERLSSSHLDSVAAHSVAGRGEEDRMHDLVARAAAHRRGLRLARRELEELGCSVVGTTPLTFRIPGRVGARHRSFVWRAGSLAVT